MRRLAPVTVALVVLTGCAASADPGDDTVVVAESPGGSVGDDLEVLQGTVTGVADAGDRVEVHVRVAWAPVLRAENRTLEVHVGAVTRFVPAGFRSRLREGDEVQVSLPRGGTDGIPAAEIAVLDLD